MSTLLAPLAQPGRPDSRISIALSDTTYHSFHDVELSEPHIGQVAAGPAPVSPAPGPAPAKQHDVPRPQEMRRQDSGYESLDRRISQTSSHRRDSTISVTSSTKRRRTRPSAQRSSQSGPISYVPRNGRRSISPQLAYRARQSPPQPVTYFHFPHFTSSDPELDETELTADPRSTQSFLPMSSIPAKSDVPAYPPPPQTTHYWTSDRTRRLEYAAIDAASKGVRGWVMRHVVPDCFVPESKRRVPFEDDRGSVVRYRLELEGEDGEEKNDRKRRKSWWFNLRRHSH